MYTELIDDDRHLRQTPLQQLSVNERRAELELAIAVENAKIRQLDELEFKRRLAEVGGNSDPTLDTGEFPAVYANEMSG